MKTFAVKSYLKAIITFAHLLAVSLMATSFVFSDDLVLAGNGVSDVEIVLPDVLPTPTISESLEQTALLLQSAFKANGTVVPVVKEKDHHLSRPAIFLGDTQFARNHKVETSALKGWGYIHRVIGKRDLIIAGHDHPAPAETTDHRRPVWDRIGTAKGVTDFLRQYAGVRFLYPEIGPYQPVSKASAIDLLTSPAIEFLPTPKIAVPDDLDVLHTPAILFNTAHPAGGSFYDISNNRFPRVDEVFGGHTWSRAAPLEEYRESHPEYFALVNGKRLLEGAGQYCISNPEVQELIYQDLCAWLDRGYISVDLGQPDGFRPCQCENCTKLHDRGDDWGEKIWIVHRNLAERLHKSHPGKQVTMMSYILTANPPSTFKAFPANTKIMLTGTNEEDIEPWREHEVPGGFTGYLYNWCPNLGTRYTPMRTPGHVETQAKRLAANQIKSFYRDGPGALFGLEGPVYYTMGRMYDDPENLFAKDLVPEFINGAFGPSAWHMNQFYDQLYHNLTLYSDFLGTRSPAWTYFPIEGRQRKMVTDPFQLLSYLYPPSLLTSLEQNLSAAEQKAKGDKVMARLALVRREFDYIKSLARVVHLHQAYQVQPDLASRDRLLDAIDQRNEELSGYWNEKGRAIPTSETWSWVMFPPAGHDYNHLRLAYNNYQEPFENSCMNWDTVTMRSAPLPGAKQIAVAKAPKPVTMASGEWSKAESAQLSPGNTTLQAASDSGAIHLRFDCEDSGPSPEAEFLEVFLSPVPGKDTAYRFRVNLTLDKKEDAALGFVTDAMDPRQGQFDPDWEGTWTVDSLPKLVEGRRVILISIPFKTLGIDSPADGSFWRGNFGRRNPGSGIENIWSKPPGIRRIDNLNAFGEIVFGEAPKGQP